MRKTSVKLSRVKVDSTGRRLYCVTWPKKGKGRNRKFFKNKLEAETFLDGKLIEQENYGTAGTSFTERQRAEYLDCCELLSPYAATLRGAVDFYLPHLKATNRNCTAAQLVAELLKDKATDGASERYLSDLRSRLGQFAAHFDGKLVAEIATTEVDQWLRHLSDRQSGRSLSATTRNNFRRLLMVAFNFAKKKGYCVGNAAKESEGAKEIKRAVGVLTIQQSADLLANADARIVPAIALGLFAGLRPESEGLHLDWSHIDFSDDTINVEPDRTKVESSARFVDMSENLVAWIRPYRQQSGRVFPSLTEYYTLLRKARKDAGIEMWPHDALRHSFGSYHYGAYQSAAITQAQMGHSNARIFFRHYRKPMKKATAERYWKIAPAVAGKKVIRFAANS